jgi:site-specific recombinase XerD
MPAIGPERRWASFPTGPRRLDDRMIEVLRVHHDSRNTEQADVHWTGRYIEFYEDRDRRELAEGDVNRFLTSLAVKRHVAASTQNQALWAILFLDQRVLEQPLDPIEGVVRPRHPKRLRVVLRVDEVSRVVAHLHGGRCLIAMRLCGGELPLLEAFRLGSKRVQAIYQEDLTDGYDIRTVQELLGHKDVRTTMICTHVLNRGGPLRHDTSTNRALDTERRVARLPMDG